MRARRFSTAEWMLVIDLCWLTAVICSALALGAGNISGAIVAVCLAQMIGLLAMHMHQSFVIDQLLAIWDQIEEEA